MTDLLRSMGVSEDDIKTEEFGNYTVFEDPTQSNKITGNQSDSVL